MTETDKHLSSGCQPVNSYHNRSKSLFAQCRSHIQFSGLRAQLFKRLCNVQQWIRLQLVYIYSKCVCKQSSSVCPVALLFCMRSKVHGQIMLVTCIWFGVYCILTDVMLRCRPWYCIVVHDIKMLPWWDVVVFDDIGSHSLHPTGDPWYMRS